MTVFVLLVTDVVVISLFFLSLVVFLFVYLFIFLFVCALKLYMIIGTWREMKRRMGSRRRLLE